MKLTKFELSAAALAAAAALFTAGYFTGRASGGDVNVTVEHREDPPPAAATDREGLIDINTATQYELMELDGVGQVLAQRIIEYRESHGPFGYIEELLNVQGVGEALLDAIADRITV